MNRALVLPRAVRVRAAAYSMLQSKTKQLFMSAVTFVAVAWYIFGHHQTLMQAGGFSLIVAGAATAFTGK